ncbi:MAG: lysylphosphatidylglycerol synthase transmembrane domain-containing protein [Pseudomonadota bacterium]
MNAPGNSAAKAKSRATGFIRIGVSIAILLFLFSFAPVGELLARMKLVSPLLWLGVFAGFLVGHAMSAAKWRWMIGGAVSYPRALKAHFAGLAANLAMPGVAGGDIVRAGLVMKGSQKKTSLAIGSLGDRLIDTASLIIISSIGAYWLGKREGVDPDGLAIVASATVGAGFAGVIMLKPIARLLRKFAPAGKFGKIVNDVADAAEEMSTRRGAVFGCAVISIVVQLGFAMMNGLIAQNIGAGTSIAAWVFAWPLAKLVATLPISFGGLGVREASIAGLMTPLGYQATGVIAASLVWQTIQFATGAIGALAHLVGPAQNGAPAENRNG